MPQAVMPQDVTRPRRRRRDQSEGRGPSLRARIDLPTTATTNQSAMTGEAVYGQNRSYEGPRRNKTGRNVSPGQDLLFITPLVGCVKHTESSAMAQWSVCFTHAIAAQSSSRIGS